MRKLIALITIIGCFGFMAVANPTSATADTGNQQTPNCPLYVEGDTSDCPKPPPLINDQCEIDLAAVTERLNVLSVQYTTLWNDRNALQNRFDVLNESWNREHAARLVAEAKVVRKDAKIAELRERIRQLTGR